MEPPLDLEAVMAAVREAFLERATREVRTIQHAAAGLADARHRPRRLDVVIRGAHTLKGTAGTVGWPDIGRAAGVVEAIARAPRPSRARLEAAVGRLAAETRQALDDARLGATVRVA